MPDPKLKVAVEEIKAVLLKHDIAGCVMLSSASHVEYLRHFDASWSCAKLENPGLLRVKSKLADYGGDKAAQRKSLEATIGMFLGFATHAREDGEALERLVQHIMNTCGGELQHFTRHEGEEN